MEIITKIPEPIIKAIKEAGRIILMAIISYAIAYITSLPETEVTLFGTLILKTIDKLLHEYGKENVSLKIKGVSPF